MCDLFDQKGGHILSTRRKIIILVIALELILTVVAGTLYVDEHNKRNNEFAEQIATNLRNNFIDHSRSIKAKYSTRIEGFVKSSPEIIRSFARQDRAGLAAHLNHRLKTLIKEDHLFTTINFIQADGTVFYHAKDKTRIGQNVANVPFVRDSLQSKKPLSGLVLALGGLGYRFSYPVYYDNKYIGLVVFIADATHSFNMLSKNFDIQWAVLIEKEHSYQTSSVPILMRNGKTLATFSGALFENDDFLDKVFQVSSMGFLHAGEFSYRKLYTLPLVNYVGSPIGEVITVLDVSTHLQEFKASLYNTGTIILAVFIVTVSVLFQGIGFFLKKVKMFQCELEETVDKRTQQLQQTNQMLVQEIKQHEFTQKNLEILSEKDALTGLYNRRKFNLQYESEWNAAQRDSRVISLIMIDIDCFKPYNDEYGHLAGDKALKVVAHAIQKNVTRPRDCVARYGGEEFICILPETSMDSTIHVAEKIRKSIEELNYPHEFSIVSDVITVSIGLISAIPEKCQNKEELIDCADKALYQAKSAGRNCIRAS